MSHSSSNFPPKDNTFESTLRPPFPFSADSKPRALFRSHFKIRSFSVSVQDPILFSSCYIWMPKSVETEDGSESNRLKTCVSNTNTKLYRADPMKRSVRPLFSLLLLIFFIATFISRAFFRRSLLASSIELNDSIPIQVETPQVPLFNETILKLASIDLSEEKTKQEVGQLLDGDMDSIGRYRAFNTWRRFNHRDIRARPSSNSVSVLLRSPNFYRHWLGFRRVLRDWWRNRRYQPEVMSELIRLVKNPIDKHNGFLDTSSRYTSCAVVGNSGILLDREFGELIDSHEVVIRLNNARTEGYEKKVGSKTSISFVNSNILHLCSTREGCFCHPYGESVPIVMYICQALHFLDYTVCNSSHTSPLIVTDPRFDVVCARILKYYSLKRFAEKQGKALTEWGSEHDGTFFHYSSGMQAIMLALGVCDKVSVFGFGKSDSAKHHYHTNQKAELRLHDYEAEYEFYHDLAQRPEAVPFIPNSFNIPPVALYR